MLWHDKLGHSNFLYLKTLYLSLFKNKDLSWLHCEFFQMVKHTFVSFLGQPYKPS